MRRSDAADTVNAARIYGLIIFAILTIGGLCALGIHLASETPAEPLPTSQTDATEGNARITSQFFVTTHGTRIECVWMGKGAGHTATGGPACWPTNQGGDPR
ncbi:MAG: hypothetical protein QM662_08555 [Gordonia sp. (in: high G+C Gram-positive bacteria)]